MNRSHAPLTFAAPSILGGDCDVTSWGRGTSEKNFREYIVVISSVVFCVAFRCQWGKQVICWFLCWWFLNGEHFTLGARNTNAMQWWVQDFRQPQRGRQPIIWPFFLKNEDIFVARGRASRPPPISQCDIMDSIFKTVAAKRIVSLIAKAENIPRDFSLPRSPSLGVAKPRSPVLGVSKPSAVPPWDDASWFCGLLILWLVWRYFPFVNKNLFLLLLIFKMWASFQHKIFLFDLLIWK